MQTSPDKTLIDESVKVENFKPTTLYRGYIPKAEGPASPTKSDPVLEKILSENLNPHRPEFADKLIWATPSEGYAKKVTTMRFMIGLATNPQYEAQVRSGKGSLPTLAEYAIQPTTTIYNAQGTHLTNEGFDKSKQFVIESVDPQDVKKRALTPEGLKEVMEVFDEKVEPAHIDTIGKATLLMDQLTGHDFLKEHHYKFGDQSIGEVLGEASKWYQELGRNKMEVEEMLAKGFFAGSLEMGELAEKLDFA